MLTLVWQINVVILVFVVTVFHLGQINGLVSPNPSLSRSPLSLLDHDASSLAPGNLVPTLFHVRSSFAWSDTVAFKMEFPCRTIVLTRDDLLQWRDSLGEDFVSQLREDGGCQVRCSAAPPYLVDSSTVLVSWNVTWIPPNSMWLQNVGTFWNLSILPTTYNHLSDKISTFSWNAVYQLLQTAVQKKELKVPLACIQGQSLLRFEREVSTEANAEWRLSSITEELVYTQELKRGALRNRKCAQDAKLFLTLGRKPPCMSWQEWENSIVADIPWESVPGMNTLDIDPEEDTAPAVFFVLASFLVLAVFANMIAPILIGQSVFGSPEYIVPPSELQSLF